MNIVDRSPALFTEMCDENWEVVDDSRLLPLQSTIDDSMNVQ